MAKPTKTQKRNMVKSIRAKAFRLIECNTMTLADFDKISSACNRAMNRLK